MVQTLKILTDAYTSRIVRGQSTLKDVTERYFWNGLSRERIYSMQSIEQHYYRGYWNSQTLDRITDHANKFYKGKLKGVL